jgi:CubicO group peptidase (beta-lactamase class C family)
LLIATQVGHAQNDYSGLWKGAIEIPGFNLELSIHLKKEQGNWSGTLDIPVQLIKEMKLGDLSIQGTAVQFKLPEVPGNASFNGKFDDKAEKLSGTFTQGGRSFPMNLVRESLTQKITEEKKLQEAIAILKHLSDSLLIRRHTPGLAFGIVKDGKVLMADGFGYRNMEKKLPVTATTQFAIGSSSKAFTATSLAILADRGQLDWEKPVIQYMPDFKLYDEFATREMTATDLTCHRSGLPRHDLMWYGSPFSRKDIFDRLRYLKPNKSFRTTWQYNNLMFMSAGYLIERISGKTWEDFVKTNIFKPLGMKNSNCSVSDLSAYAEPATGYRTEKDKNIRMEYRNLDAIGPAGSINSTVNDMLEWVKLHLGDDKTGDAHIVSDAELARMHKPHMLMDESGQSKSPELTDPSYGLAWFAYRHKGLKVVEHGGNIDGFTALVYLIPEKDFGLVILCNQNGAGLPSVLARYATDQVLGLDYTDWYSRTYGKEDKKEEKKETEAKPEPKRVEGTKPSHNLTSYVGEYEEPGYGTAEIMQEGNNLRLKFHAFNLALEHWHYDVFRAQDTTLDISMMLNFKMDPGGNIYQFATTMDPESDDVQFSKVAPRRLSDPDFLRKLTGKYQFEKDEMTVTIELIDKILYAKVPGQPTYTLVPFQGTEFKLKGLNGYSVEFEADGAKAFKEAIFIQPNGAFHVKKVE